MRKKNTLMAALALAIVSLMPCTVVGQENKFTITGKASDFADGKKERATDTCCWSFGLLGVAPV